MEGTLTEKYEQAFASLDEVLEKRVQQQRYTALGFASNLDIILDFQVERLNELLDRYLPDARLEEMKPANVISTMEDFLRTIVYFCNRGIGGEVDIENTALFKECFPYQYGMGGTAVQAALALAQIGCPSVVHLTDDSKEVCKLLESPYIFVASKDGSLIHTDQVVSEHEHEIHGVIQFKKDDVICLGEERIVIPASNRFMLTKNTVNAYVPFSKPYFDWVKKNAERTGSIVISSFNVMLDEKLLEEKILDLQKFARKYHLSNPQGIVWCEDGHYHEPSIRKLYLESLRSFADIMSMNEEELVYTLQDMYHYEVDETDIFSCIEGLGFLQKKLGIRQGMILHTKDYSMYVGQPLGADMEQGLIYGNLLATAKAQNGSYGTKEKIKEVLSFGFSRQGLDNYEKVINSSYADEVVMVPSKYIEKPRYTVGLGDSFVGGVQVCF